MTIDKLIKVESQNSDIQKLKGTDFEKLKRKINGICSSLNRSSDGYEVQRTINSIKNYLKYSDRVIYSEISGYYFSLSEDARGNFNTNVEYLLVTCMSDEKMDREIQQCVLKIYDHVHLAVYQVDKLQSNTEDNEIKNIFAKNLEPVKTKLEKDIEKTYKELYAQLIALIGIFTAMAFLIFGSISSLGNIFNDFNEMPITKLIAVACVWGLSVLNLVFIFMYFVSKMTKLELTKNNYLLVAWANLLLITIFLLSIWHYFIRKRKLTDYFEGIIKNHAIFISILGFMAILALFLISVIIIIRVFKSERAQGDLQ